MCKDVKMRDGFQGEKLLNIPLKLLKEAQVKRPELFRVYITEIGYFPKADFHHRERKKGCHDNILIYCVAGKGHYIIDNQQHTVNCNEYVILPATNKYMRYWADKDNPWTIYWIHFTGSHIDIFNRSLSLDLSSRPLLIHFNEKGIELWKKIYNILDAGFTIDNLCSASFCLYHLLATFLFPQRHQQSDKEAEADIVTKTIDNMRLHIDKKLTVEFLAEKHSLSISHFSSIFRKATGSPPIDYFNRLKMQKACQLLFASNDKLKSVAMDLGYSDPFYFSRLFKQYMGASPAQYRASARISG